MKLRQLEELPALIGGRNAVVVHGYFDILRAEHVRYLEEARRRGDILIVGVYSDLVASTTNEKRCTILSPLERTLLISALRCVDYVVVIEESQVGHMLDVLRPAAAEGEPIMSDVIRRIQQIHESA
jgi:cytidyltransferase-like protein